MTTEGPELTQLLYTRELSERLGLPRWRILKLAKAGSLPHYKLGRCYVFPANAVARWIEDQTQRGAP